MLELIIENALCQRLKIPRANFESFSCVLAIPDLINRKEIKHYMDLALQRLGFKSCFLHVESVLATFSGPIQHSLVVDIGSEKINICGIEDGSIVEGTLIRKNFGH